MTTTPDRSLTPLGVQLRWLAFWLGAPLDPRLLPRRWSR
ncbi:hypothetical protein SAMN04488107_1780 [Geodermatophilus saharensis]|uniref:Uncharacterized protein n=1 Tax=Geodermatophilus saharensis TaxID=1137994 RepID=A0A239CRY9_9ACTN|nr:hypothetical protein SAMN04488107_1780 [Geodermatophilus saharensis]